MHLISIDPGQSTGIAVYHDGQLVEALTLSAPSELRRQLRVAMRTHPGVDVVCEKGPTDRRHQEAMCAMIEQVVREEALKIYWVQPSEWKGHPASRLTDAELTLIDSRHERDAASMGKRFISTGTYGSMERGVSSGAVVRS